MQVIYLLQRTRLVYGTAHGPCQSGGRQPTQMSLAAQEPRSINNRYEAWELKTIGASKVEQLLCSHLRSKTRSVETQ